MSIVAASLAAGWFLARALTAGAFLGPRWSSLLVELSLGALFGPGLASILCLMLLRAGVATPASVWAAVAAMLAALAAVWWRLTPAALKPRPEIKGFPCSWALWICAATALIFFLLDFQAAAGANPYGEWDAMSIWNLRARFLSSGDDLWRRAVSSEFGGGMAGAAHPAYPLFLSGFVALPWIAAGGFPAAVPIAASLLFALATLALLGASIAARKAPVFGILAWLILLASEVFASQAAAQYSDVLQGLAFLATLVLLEACAPGSPRMLIAVGLAAGLSAWIKNEGLPFSLAALAVALWRFRLPGAAWLAIGAAPGLLSTATLKLFLAQGREAVFPQTLGEAVAKIAAAGRWWQAALGFAKAIFEAGAWWSHPVLLAALVAFAFRFAPPAARKQRIWLFIPVGITVAAEYGLYLVTEASLDWHISTSVGRLVTQLWPPFIWLFFLLLREPAP
ncbi:MAG TPA: hypothetical protein VKV74_15620 [Bryobacteraceae bacterium]|nr:hypothetical protein [Bryobacteraceae bacterium]